MFIIFTVLNSICLDAQDAFCILGDVFEMYSQGWNLLGYKVFQTYKCFRVSWPFNAKLFSKKAVLVYIPINIIWENVEIMNIKFSLMNDPIH